MLKKLLAEKGVILTKELSDWIIQDVAFNRIGFNKTTNLEELLIIAERCSIALSRCA